MERNAGLWVLGAAAAMFALTVFAIRPRVSRGVTDGLVALWSAALAAGALMVQRDVTQAEWLLTIPVTAVLGVVNIRAMFTGSGPLRI